MQSIVVRSETAGDIKAIDVVNLSAFEGEAEAQFVDALRSSPAFVPELSLVAELNGRVVGHVLLTKVPFKRRDGIMELLALAPMSVVPSQSHRGIGSDLIQAAIEKGRELGFGAIVVVGHPDYYERFGFRKASEWGLSCNLRVPGDAVTALELREGALEGGGVLDYPVQFEKLFSSH